MNNKTMIFIWLIIALAITASVGYAMALGESLGMFFAGLLLAMAVQQLGLHIRKEDNDDTNRQ